MALLWCLILIPTAAKAEVAVAARLTAQDKIDLKRVEDYLERLSTLKSSFLQTSSNGNVATGKLFISRPGKLRFKYDISRLLVVFVIEDQLMSIDLGVLHVAHQGNGFRFAEQVTTANILIKRLEDNPLSIQYLVLNIG